MTKLTQFSLLAVALSVLSGCMDVRNAWCPPEKIAKYEPVKLEALTLSADALFKFDQFTLNGIRDEDRVKLDTFIENVNKNADRINALTVIGHTDRLGSDAYNDELGLNRAETMKTLLQNGGVSVPVSAESMGKRQPVTSNCEGKGAELKTCLQPDRRVVISVTYK